MIVTLLLLIVFILLFGAGVVKGWLANIFGYGIGGFILLAIALKLGSYMGEYGLLWVIGIVGLIVGGGLGIGIYFEERAKQKWLDEISSRSAALRTTDPLPAHKVWGQYVQDIREHFSPQAQNQARALYAAEDAAGLEKFCRAEIRRINQRRYG